MTAAELINLTVTCPHCWEPHQACIDTSAGDQTYIEDCSICCHPMEFTIRVANDELVALNVQASQ